MLRTPLAACLSVFLLLVAPVAVRPEEDSGDRWAALDRAAQDAVSAGNVPGVVFVVGSRGKVLYQKAFGDRRVQPEKTPMTLDTVFDLASLTKVVATTSAVMALVEEGKLRLADPAARYWPE